MAQNDKDSLNEVITESITELDKFYPEREEKPRNRPLNVNDRVICDYDGRQRIKYGRKYGRSRGY